MTARPIDRSRETRVVALAVDASNAAELAEARAMAKKWAAAGHGLAWYCGYTSSWHREAVSNGMFPTPPMSSLTMMWAERARESGIDAPHILVLLGSRGP